VDIYEWLSYGMEQGFCTDVVCETHDGIPQTMEEIVQWDAGEDPCVPALRIWRDDDEPSR
jgi:hypothetical protein